MNVNSLMVFWSSCGVFANRIGSGNKTHGVGVTLTPVDVRNCQIGKHLYAKKIRADLQAARHAGATWGRGDVKGGTPSRPGHCVPSRFSSFIWICGSKRDVWGKSPSPLVPNYTSGPASFMKSTPYRLHNSSIFNRSLTGTTYTPWLLYVWIFSAVALDEARSHLRYGDRPL